MFACFFLEFNFFVFHGVHLLRLVDHNFILFFFKLMINFQNFYNFAACLKLTEFSRLVAYSSFVLNFIAGENTVGFSLRGVGGVWLAQKMLDSHEDLFDGDSRSPVLFFVEDREANGARRMEGEQLKMWVFKVYKLFAKRPKKAHLRFKCRVHREGFL